MIKDQEHQATEKLSQDSEKSGLYAVAARYESETKVMHVTLKRGFTVSFSKERSQVMANAKDEDLREIDIAGFGNYIIFPALDDGFTVEGMLAGRFGNRQWEEMWAEKQGLAKAA